MNITLINPPRFNEIIGNNPSIIEEERGYNPPLGLLHIAACIEEHTQHVITVIDCQVEEIDYRALEDRLRAALPDVVGITAMTLTLIDVLETIKVVKKINPRTLVVLGGPHVNIFPEETIALPGVDYLVLGEGEEAVLELLDALGNDNALENIKGLVFKKERNIVNTGLRPMIQDLDKLPFPARHLVPYKKYYSLLAKRRPATTTFTSRGCPFNCSFCDRPHLGKKFRYRSAENVVDEMEECVKMGIHEFLVYDDTFTVNKKRVLAVCDEIIRRKLDVGWDIRSRVDTIDSEMLRALRKAGCNGIHYGVEAGTEKILKVLNKNINLSKVAEVFRLTKKEGLQVLAYFMIGSPGETGEDILETFKVARSLDPDFIHLTVFTPFPATKLYQNGLESGIIKKDYWREFARNPHKDFDPPHWDELFSREELAELLRIGYKDFYTRPLYILRELAKVKTLGEIKRKVRAGLKVFGMGKK